MNQLAVFRKRPSGLSAWLSRHLALLVWNSTAWKQFAVVAPILGGCLFGASLLLASAPGSLTSASRSPVTLAHEEFTPPMVRLLHDMDKANRLVTPAAASQSGLLTGPIAKPFFYGNVGGDRDRALTCLATAGWYEAGNDPAGQRAVMQVVLNRVRHPAFPKSVCAVVFQGFDRPTGCQFSFTCDGSMTRRFPSPGAWAQARLLAEGALNGAVDPDVRQATHFHADYVSPWWAAKLDPIVKIGAHIFYRWSGARGALGTGNAATMKEAIPVLANAGNTFVASTAGQSGPKSDPLTNFGASARTPKPLGDAAQTTSLSLPAESVVTSRNSIQRLFMRVDEAGPNGRWALAAMDLCAGNGPCRVVASGQGTASLSGAAPDGTTTAKPLFLFVRDSAGMQVALWDCDRAPRPRADQCMPSGEELKRFLN